jgi:hydroxymethylbilane synthase
MGIPDKAMLKIGTRDSELALWQAKKIQADLAEIGIETELVLIKSAGDIDLKTPLSELGGKGIFTKALDHALLDGRIDLAVHSYKDLPTEQPLPLVVAAISEREDPRDVLVAPRGTDWIEDAGATLVIATGSNRRRAQWMAKYPNSSIEDIRGNVNTRLAKTSANTHWNGCIFAAAGLKRIGLNANISAYLDWMIPAPAQGALAVMCHEENHALREQLAALNHKETAICTDIERQFLNEMEAGCSAPLGAYARYEDNEKDGDIDIVFEAVVMDLLGKKHFSVSQRIKEHEAIDAGRIAARELLDEGAAELMKFIQQK